MILVKRIRESKAACLHTFWSIQCRKLTSKCQQLFNLLLIFILLLFHDSNIKHCKDRKNIPTFQTFEKEISETMVLHALGSACQVLVTKVPHLQRYNFFSLKSKMVGISKNFNPRMPYSSIDLNGYTPTDQSLHRLHC